jgi:hypothetical protein
LSTFVMKLDCEWMLKYTASKVDFRALYWLYFTCQRVILLFPSLEPVRFKIFGPTPESYTWYSMTFFNPHLVVASKHILSISQAILTLISREWSYNSLFLELYTILCEAHGTYKYMTEICKVL